MGITAVVEEYDPATDTWTRRADMPTARQGLCTAAVDGIIYGIGGWSPGGDSSTVEAYDPVTDRWTRKADMPTERTLAAIAVVDGIIYVIGGNTSVVGAPWVASVIEAYDPARDRWTRKADMPTARYATAACVVDGRIYVSGGATKYGKLSGEWDCVPTVEVYDPATDTWTQASDMPITRLWHTASVVDGKMYIIGGGNPELHQAGDELFPTIDVYDPGTDTWTTAADFPNPRSEHTAVVVDGKIYTIGGRHSGPGSSILPIVEEYDPALPDSISVTNPAGKLLRTWGEVKSE
jgi:N-acetylneuraminic acid mutarotase